MGKGVVASASMSPQEAMIWQWWLEPLTNRLKRKKTEKELDSEHDGLQHSSPIFLRDKHVEKASLRETSKYDIELNNKKKFYLLIDFLQSWRWR